MSKQFEAAIKAITAALTEIDPVDAKYLLRYVGSRLEQSDDDIIGAFLADRADREMADRIAEHRREKVLNDAASELGVSVDALLEGVETAGTASDTGKEN